MLASFIYGVTYIVFNILWYVGASGDDRVIYKTMDWGEDIGEASLFAVIVVFVLVPLFGLVHYGVFRCVQFCSL